MEPKIVTGLTDSENAASVLDVARAFARRLGLLLEVVSSPTDDVFTVGAARDDLVAAGREALAAAVDLSEVDRVTVTPGPPAPILRGSMAEGAVLGVVGTRGRGPLRGALLGSVSTELSKTAPSPVVIVPEAAPVPVLDDDSAMVVRLDGTSEDLPTLHAAVHLADALGARMLAINIASTAAGSPLLPPAERVERELAHLPDVPTAIRVETDDPVGTLREVADMHDAALLVVGGRDTSRLRDGLRGNLAVNLVAEARRPVVVIPPGADAGALRHASLAQAGA